MKPYYLIWNVEKEAFLCLNLLNWVLWTFTDSWLFWISLRIRLVPFSFNSATCRLCSSVESPPSTLSLPIINFFCRRIIYLQNLPLFSLLFDWGGMIWLHMYRGKLKKLEKKITILALYSSGVPFQLGHQSGDRMSDIF